MTQLVPTPRKSTFRGPGISRLYYEAIAVTLESSKEETSVKGEHRSYVPLKTAIGSGLKTRLP